MKRPLGATPSGAGRLAAASPGGRQSTAQKTAAAALAESFDPREIADVRA